MEFNDFCWHDSVIKNIVINRDEFREMDMVYFDIEWYDNGTNKLIFENVYQVKFNMNFGVIGPELISNAYVSENDLDLINLYKIWNGLIDDIKLNCYIIKTASTGSEMKILAKDFKII